LNHDSLQFHSHEPNPEPPDLNPTFRLTLPGGIEWLLTEEDLAKLPQSAVSGCYIVSTGHGTSGPFTFSGVTLYDLIGTYYDGPWREVEIVSADGFGSRVLAEELQMAQPTAPILLAIQIDGRPLTRNEGLVRLIVPFEREDALRQVKWISIIRVK
jgi:DMSO/TMAO reductase YedYZ molybdopterin-dependent catalytic subunit